MMFRRADQLPAKPSFLSIISLTASLVLLTSGPIAVGTSHAQEPPPPITSSGLNTVVTTNGSVHNITGGTRPGDGLNLFHSFGEFGVPTNNIANFLNETALPTNNILGRVTGVNPSNIFGTIQTTDFGNANLFLMNPAGILFGPNATLDVRGSVVFTTANSVRLFDGTNSATFYANPASDAVTTPGRVSILSAAPLVDFGFVTPTAFGFLDPTPASITMQGSTLSVDPGQSISFVGGDFTMTGGNLSAPSGQVGIVSVASAGEILHQDLRPAPNINDDSFSAMGTINLSQGAVVDVSANAAGTIRIRGGQFVIANGTLSADTVNTDGAPIAISINVTGDLSITDTRGVPVMTARTIGTGDSGEIRLTTGNLVATSTFDPSSLTTLINSHTSGDGRGGDVHITTGNLTVAGPGNNAFYFIDSGTVGVGNGRGGNISIQANIVDLDWTSISTGQDLVSPLLEDTSGVNGSAGNLTIAADTLQLKNSILNTSAFLGLSEFQKGGDITLKARDISMMNTQVGSTGLDGGGTFDIKADRLVTDFTFFETVTVSGQGGAISVEAPVVELTNGSALINTTFGNGNTGNISLTATEHVKILGDVGTNPQAVFSPSGIFSNSFGDLGSQGNAGNVIVTTPKLEMVAGRINTVTASSGQGGNVTLNVIESISISGEFLSDRLIVPSIFDISPLAPSGIVTSTVGSEFCTGPSCGNAGNVFINTGSLSMGAGSQVNSGTSSTGDGGLVTINASDTISMSGRQSDGSPVGISSRSIGVDPDAGSGGNIALIAGQSVTISNGASVSASSTSLGNAGNISIDAGQQFEMRDSSVKTEAAQAGGGNIDIRAVDRVRLVDSTISTSVLGGGGSGGNITIDPNIVVLQNSNVIAQAIQGAGGNITIVTPLFLADSSSLVSASSQFGLNGTVTIQSPTSNLSGSLGTLTSKPSQAQSLVTQRCAALANGQASSFVVAGREQLPSDPGSWLSSPIALAGIDTDPFRDGTASDSTSNFAPRTSGLLASDRVSLRRLTPARFLIANFAESEATGCHS